MPDCWKALMKFSDVDIRVFIEKRRSNREHEFSESSLGGIPYLVCDREESKDYTDWLRQIHDFQPDIIQATGWHSRLSQAVARADGLSRVPKILGLDMPYRKTLKQRLAPLVLAPYLNKYKAVCVSGERAAQYARFLGFQDHQIESGLYGFDCKRFSEAALMRSEASWPRHFVFSGRLCRDKGIDILLSAYSSYREAVADPWGLSFCGKGEYAAQLDGVAGITNLGFIMPQSLPSVLSKHGVFVLPSRFEPWGVALGEACAAGMPVIATSECGASIELIRPYYNGLVVAKNDVKSLADAMIWMHEHENLLPDMGKRSMSMAAAFDVDIWAYRWRELGVKWGCR